MQAASGATGMDSRVDLSGAAPVRVNPATGDPLPVRYYYGPYCSYGGYYGYYGYLYDYYAYLYAYYAQITRPSTFGSYH